MQSTNLDFKTGIRSSQMLSNGEKNLLIDLVTGIDVGLMPKLA